MDYRLVLDYRLSAGRLTPWIEGLRIGKARAHCCGECGRVSFPPERRCSCGSIQTKWMTLPGSATILQRSDGPENSFALARFEGADTLTSVRLHNPEIQSDRGRLLAVPEGPPAQVLALVKPEADAK